MPSVVSLSELPTTRHRPERHGSPLGPFVQRFAVWAALSCCRHNMPHCILNPGLSTGLLEVAEQGVEPLEGLVAKQHDVKGLPVGG